MSDMPPLRWVDGMTHAYESVELLGEGDFYECFLLDGSTVVRIGKHEQASRALLREMRLLPALAGHLSVPIPAIESGGFRADNDARFVSYPLLRGTELATDSLTLLGTSDRHRLIEQMARFVRELHDFPVEVARSLGLPELDPVEYFPALLLEAAGPVRPHLSATVWSYYEQLVEQYLQGSRLRSQRFTLLHGDLSPGHFLADLERIELTGIIDFGDACIGDPWWDLIYLLADFGEVFLAEFLSLYDPHAGPEDTHRIRVYRQLNNLQYCLTQLEEGDPVASSEAMETLREQAGPKALL